MKCAKAATARAPPLVHYVGPSGKMANVLASVITRRITKIAKNARHAVLNAVFEDVQDRCPANVSLVKTIEIKTKTAR